MPDFKLIARSVLTGTDDPFRMEKRLFPGGGILVLLAPMCEYSERPGCRQGFGDQTTIDVWSIRDPTTPRRILRTSMRVGWVVDDVVLQQTKTGTVGRIVLACRREGCEEYAIECYDIQLAEGDPAVPGADPAYERIIAESWQPIPPLPEGKPVDWETWIELSAHSLAGDIIACTLQELDRPRGDYDESAGEYNEQLNPRFPLPGYERINLVHLSGTTGRWLDPCYTEPFISVKAYAHDDHLYLLGRTASTYVVQSYSFSEDMLLSSVDSSGADDYLSLGSPIAESESDPLPDPRVPWGEFDSQKVHFDPIHGFTILLLRHWWGEGQVLHLPLPRRDIAGEACGSTARRPTAHASRITAPHLPGWHKFTEIWLGRKHALLKSESDDLRTADDFDFTLLSFKFGEDCIPDAHAHEPLSNSSGSPVSRYDLKLREAGVEMPPYMQGGFAVDERSGRMCTMRAALPAQNGTELLVFSLGLGPQS